MKMRVNFDMFCYVFEQSGRYTFTNQALKAIFDHLENDDPEYQLNVVAICCEIEEDLIEFVAQRKDINPEGIEMSDDEVIKILRDKTTVISESPLVFYAF